jgi:hypothetical protein
VNLTARIAAMRLPDTSNARRIDMLSSLFTKEQQAWRKARKAREVKAMEKWSLGLWPVMALDLLGLLGLPGAAAWKAPDPSC